MATVDVSVKCSKEAVELGQGLAKFVGSVKQALADGWQVGSDMPAIVRAAMSDLVPALSGADKVKDELNQDVGAFVNACMVSGSAILGVVVK